MHLISVLGQSHTHILYQKYFRGTGISINLQKNVINKHMIFCKFLPTIQIVHRSNDPDPISRKIYQYDNSKKVTREKKIECVIYV